MPETTDKKALLEAADTSAVPPSLVPFDIRARLEAPPGPRFSEIRSEFKRRFYGKVEGPRPAVMVRRHRLLSMAPGAPIVQELGGQAAVETTFAAAYWLIKRQGWGAGGFLQTNGHASVFHVRDLGGELCAVRAGWDEEGWVIDAVPAEDPPAWSGRHEIFCPVPAPGGS